MRAQQFDQAAIDRLCEAFKPLILTEAYNYFVIENLGEDAENIAWEIFLTAVHSVQLTEEKRLQAYFKKMVHFELLKKIRRAKGLEDYTSIDELAFTLADDRNPFEFADGKMDAEKLMEGLSPLQKEMIKKRYFEGYESLKFVGYSSRTNYYYKLKQALKIIKQAYLEN